MTKIITLFNHKGGVGKTTNVFHIAWKMAELGKKVLMVDADPQCNLTGLTLGLDKYDDLFKFYESKKNTDIFNSLAPVFGIDNDEIASPGSRTSMAKTNHPNLQILAGNIRLAEIDIQIGTALTSSNTIPILRRFVSAINELLRKIAIKEGFDVVVVDVSPSVSATNQCMLMGADYFIIPVSPDFYCYQAIDSLCNVFPRWEKDMRAFKTGYADGFSLPKNNPKMLGFISQNYRVYTVDKPDNEQQKTMAKAYREWTAKIKDVTNQQLVPALKQTNMVVSEEVFKQHVKYDVPYHLAGIQDFNSLLPVSQKCSKPIYCLEQSDGGWTGAIWSNQEKNIQEADKVYTSLAQSILQMIEP